MPEPRDTPAASPAQPAAAPTHLTARVERWNDLRVRVASGAAMVAIGIIALIAGGVLFQMIAVFATAVMVWELWMMIAPERPTPGMLLAALVASTLSGSLAVGSAWMILLLGAAPIIGIFALEKERATFALFALAIQLAGWGLVEFRAEFGFLWLLWLALVVVVTDVAGYFLGRMIGGPKFWPKISPKKTWAGTISGWVGAALVGLGFWLATEAGFAIVVVSVILSFASQMGDIAESALKRRMKVKDSSTLIPGHGGLFDRFDALLGAALFLLLVVLFVDIPGVAF